MVKQKNTSFTTALLYCRNKALLPCLSMVKQKNTSFTAALLYCRHNVVFTNKRSQAKVFTVYLSLAAGYSYLECNTCNYTLALYTLSAELNQDASYLYTLTLHWPVRN